MPGVLCLCGLEIAHPGVLRAGVELHVGDDVQGLRQLLLRQAVLNRRGKDQVENLLNVGVGHLVELRAVADPLKNVLPPDLHQPGAAGEGDEVVAERPCVPLGKVDPQRQGHFRRPGLGVPIHGPGAVHHHQSVLPIVEFGQGVPGNVDSGPLLIGHAAPEEGGNDLIGVKGPCVQLRLPGLDPAGEIRIAFPVVPQEGLAVLEQRLGGLLFVVEGVVLFPKIVFDDADIGTELHQGLAVDLVCHAQIPGDPLCLRYGLPIGGVDRREPLG